MNVEISDNFPIKSKYTKMFVKSHIFSEIDNSCKDVTGNQLHSVTQITNYY